MNDRIRADEVLLIDDEGTKLGIKTIGEALSLAASRGLDLVEVAPNGRPPVCKVLDYGKFKYEEKKKEQSNRKKQHQVEIKELRVRMRTDPHDLEIKMKKARGFLGQGHKVMFNLMFRGRERRFMERGKDVLSALIEPLSEIARVEKEPTPTSANRMCIIFAPK